MRDFLRKDKMNTLHSADILFVTEQRFVVCLGSDLRLSWRLQSRP